MFRSGYNGSSVRDIVAEAGVPQGSFTNHFRSEESFAEVVLNRYFACVQGLVREALEDKALTPRARLRRYLDIITTRLEADQWARGCLIGDLSLEATGHSEALRTRLAAIYEEWRAPFAACIAEAQAAGEIPAKCAATDLAEFLLASWQGAILSPLEYRLLQYLMHHAGRAVSQIELTEHVYGQDFERDSNAIEVLVARLRRKLGADAVRTRRGYGYHVGELSEGA
jgi:TetR/AcrR family transcriptional repressor of nem operon